MNLKIVLLSLAYFISLAFVNAQTNEIVDSLKLELKKCKHTEDSVYILCRITWRMDNDQKAEKLAYGILALQTAEKIEDKHKLSEAYDAAASGHWANDNLQKAKDLFKESLRIGKENSYYGRIGYSAYHLAQIYISENNFDSATHYSTISREAFNKEGRYDMVLRNGWLLIKSDRENKHVHINNLIAEIKKSIASTTEPNQLLFRYLDLSRLYNLLENKNQSMQYVQLAMDIADETENIKGLSKAYYLIGDYFRDNQKNYDIALIYYRKILEIYKKINYELGIADVYNEIGNVYKLSGNDSLARNYFSKSLQIGIEKKHRHSMANAYSNLGEINYSTGNYKDALHYYTKCYETGCDQCPQIVFHPALINMGNVYLNTGEYTNALNSFNEALAIADSSDAIYEQAVSFLNLARYHEERHNLNKSLSLYNTAYDLAKRANSLQLQADITKHLSRMYSNSNHYRLAFTYLEQTKLLSDSIEAISKADNLSMLETRFEFQQLQVQRELEKAKSEKEIARQKLIRNLVISGIILIAILGIFIYISYRRKKKDNILLHKQKQAIEDMSKKVHEADQARLQFYTNVSHELRTPLTLILGMTDKLKSSLQNNQFTPVIRKNALKLLQLINHLLDLRKLDTSNMELKVSQGNLYDFIRGISASFDEYALQKNIVIEINSRGKDVIGYFDHEKLEKVLSNLISNAIKYTNDKGDIKISIKKDTDGYAKLEIKDNGVGISEKELKHIFNRFYRISENGGHGSGIGLAIVKELIELHKGEIKVKSKKDEGSVFILTFPVDSRYYTKHEIVEKDNGISSWNYPEVLDVNEEENNDKSADMIGPDAKTILIVEDNNDLRKFIADIFKEEYEVITAENGEKGFKQSLEYIPDIIISDIMMPKLSGIQLIDKLKNTETTSHIPIILLTAKDDIGTRLNSFEKGADDYISKPFDSAILKSRVENLLRLRRQLVEKFSKQFHLQPKEISIENADKKFLEKTISIIENHISNPNLNIDLLAMELGVSRTQLYRKLKALTDYSANQFIRIIRLKRAAQILQQGQNNIAEVMDATGFSNYSYFNNCFKEYFGEFPKDYALLSINGSLN